MRKIIAGAAVAVAVLSAGPALAAPQRAVADAPSRYHCVSYGGHGYHRCSGGYGRNDDPNWGDYRPPSDASDCPRPHSHTGDPYGPGCGGQQNPKRAGGPTAEPLPRS